MQGKPGPPGFRSSAGCISSTIIDVYVNVISSGDSSMDIQGKVFIVTGGASGLGEGTARMLAAAGGRVVIADMQADKGEAV
ncbi:SDR family NAD(P)-dependent oxidoreductase, partial [Azospirillum brasilense]|uniref:SDR family NAD(P)-dependent oxidoreductase n=1 Tax=Azospirillum brasilense TaxID=192 RepID=UPI0034D25CAA